MDEAGEFLAVFSSEFHRDGHAPGWLELGDGEVEFVAIEGRFADLPRALVVVFRAVVFGALEVPCFDREAFRLDGVG